MKKKLAWPMDRCLWEAVTGGVARRGWGDPVTAAKKMAGANQDGERRKKMAHRVSGGPSVGSSSPALVRRDNDSNGLIRDKFGARKSLNK
jgi:hypothetical protein